jgi:hypothetical protein
MRPLNNRVRISDVSQLLKRAADAGYGRTIELKVNGEYYEVVD